MLATEHAGATPIRRRTQPDQERRAEAADRRRLSADLRQSVASGGFLLHFQPRYALDGGAARGAEALIRWPHRRRGLLAPAAFLPLAEQTDLVTPIGAWVLQRACAEAASWPQQFALSVNVSPRQMRGGALIRQVAAALERSGLAPERLALELPESMLPAIDEDALLTMAALRDAGIGLALDDFGSIYASVAALKRLPLTVLKLDRALVRGLPHEADDSAIVRAVLGTGQALGLTVVAEGVETEAQRAFLVGIGVDEAQGYLLGRPVPASELRLRLAAGARVA